MGRVSTLAAAAAVWLGLSGSVKAEAPDCVSFSADHADRAISGRRERRSAVQGFADAASKHLGRPATVAQQARWEPPRTATGDDGCKRQGRRIYYRADGNPRVPHPLHAEGEFRSGQGLHLHYEFGGYTLGPVVKADDPFKKWQDVIEFSKANPGSSPTPRSDRVRPMPSPWS